MDNRQFNVKGRSKEQLKATLSLLLMSEYEGRENKVRGWEYIPEIGFVIYTFISERDKDVNKFPTPLSAETITDIVWDWLQGEDAKKFKITEAQDINYNHDGSNSVGFRVYNERWSRISDKTGSIGAIVPAYCWYGK